MTSEECVRMIKSSLISWWHFHCRGLTKVAPPLKKRTGEEKAAPPVKKLLEEDLAQEKGTAAPPVKKLPSRDTCEKKKILLHACAVWTAF